MDPPSRILPSDGLQFCDPNLFWEYQFEMALNVESELRMFLATLVTFRQTRKLAHFLGYFADVLELTLPKGPGRFPRFTIRFDFSANLCLEYCTKHSGCVLWIDGKQDFIHPVPPAAMDALRKMIVDVWEILRDKPIWELISETDESFTVRRIPLI